MNRRELADDLFRRGFVCSQAVFAAFAENLGLDPATALKIAAPFGGGLGRMGHVCGAVSGACMVLGLAYGGSDPEDRLAKDTAYSRAQRFARVFEERHGTIMCRDLIGCDLREPEQRETARARGVFDTVCPGLVRDAAEILEVLLAGDPGSLGASALPTAPVPISPMPDRSFSKKEGPP